MPRYFFNIEHDRKILDDQGSELLDLQEAHYEALRSSGELLLDRARSTLWSDKPWRMWVTDKPSGEGNTLFTLQFSTTDGAGRL